MSEQDKAAPVEQEPVAWMDRDGDVYPSEPSPDWCPPHTPLYRHPAQWVGLTEEEVQDSYNKDYQAQTRAIEQLLKEKNS